MIPPEIPKDESTRLEALRRYKILDTASEEAFEDIVRVAAQVCCTPIALVSLVDRDRQWFKASVGMNLPETPREIGFCAHAILSPEPLVVPDTTADRRFCENPLVTSDPKVRFYAGIPLTTPEGQRIGALCVIDHVPRRLTTPQLEAMRVLSHTVMTQLELRRSLGEQQKIEREIRSINSTLERRVHERGAALEDVLQRLKEEMLDREHREQRLRNREDRIRRQNHVLVELATRQLANPGNVIGALEGILEAAARTLEVARASIWLYDELRTKIRCVDLFERGPGKHSSGIELTAKSFPAYFKALEAERTIAADNARTDPATREFSELYLVPLGITSMLDAPIRLGGRCVGVVCNEHVGEGRIWGDEEQSFAASIADAISLAMEAGEREAAK
ncbi:MAG TPA: GAF domain-containing protein, partial [Planctomycetota bacterium]|nr:GAF domain-containing protein [Planctomycetota bacterium]